MKLIPAFIHRRIAHRQSLVKIADNIGWLFFDKILRMGVGLLVGVWVARYLGPEQFGMLNFATAFVSMFGAIAGLGLQSIVVREILRNPACREETLGTAATLLFLGGTLAYGLTIGTIFWLRPDDALAKVLVAIIGSTMLLKASEVAVFWFEAQVQSKYTVWVQNGCFLVFAGVKSVLIIKHASLIAFAWVIFAEVLIVAIIMGSILGMRGPKWSQLFLTLGRTKALLKDSWPLMLSGVSIMIYMKIDQIMLGQLEGNEAVGIYSAAVRISELWYFIPMTIVASIFPAILEAKKRGDAHYKRRLQQLYDLMVGLSVAIALPMTFLSTPIVTRIFGEAFSTAGVVLSIHIWAAVFVFIGVASAQWFIVENRQILAFQRTMLGGGANVALNYLLIPSFGAVGAAVATVISQAVAALFFDAIQSDTREMFMMKMKSLNPLRIIKKLS